VSVGSVDHETIDRINILQATHRAMGEALRGLAVQPDFIITDFVTLRDLACPQKNLVDGDARCATVAAASIVAKVTRDRLMMEADRQYPAYGFARHKGYATPEHLAALDRWGPCPLHRRTFAGVWRQGELFRDCVPAHETSSATADYCLYMGGPATGPPYPPSRTTFRRN
jgi:ribonuclease HII